MGFMSSVQAWVGYILMPSSSRNFASASGEGQTKPVGTLFGLALKATKVKSFFNVIIGN